MLQTTAHRACWLRLAQDRRGRHRQRPHGGVPSLQADQASALQLQPLLGRPVKPHQLHHRLCPPRGALQLIIHNFVKEVCELWQFCKHILFARNEAGQHLGPGQGPPSSNFPGPAQAAVWLQQSWQGPGPCHPSLQLCTEFGAGSPPVSRGVGPAWVPTAGQQQHCQDTGALLHPQCRWIRILT